AIDNNGIIYLRTTGNLRESVLNPGPPRLLRLTRNGEILDTLYLELPRLVSDKPSAATIMGSNSQAGLVQLRLEVPFTPKVLWAISPLGYLITGVTERYAFEIR